MKKFFKQLLTTPTTNITKAAFVIAVASLTSRVLAVFRDRVLASEFGAGDILDIYYAAFRIPDLIYNLIIVGALSAGFIPVFLAARDHKQNTTSSKHWYLTNAFITIAGVGVIALSLTAAIFIDGFVPWLAPGFDADKLTTLATLTRIMFLSPVLLGFSAILGGVLQSYRQFFVYSLAPIFYNVGIIVGALFFVPSMGVTGLAWGVVLGAFLHLAIQFPAVRSLGWRFRFVWDLRHEGLRMIGRLMVPRTLSLGAQQINLFLLTIIASFLSSGSIAIFNFASNLYFVPVAIFGISYGLAAFPALSDRALKGDKAGFRRLFSVTVRQILFFIVPMTVLFIILRAQIVRIILGSGAFSWTDTVLTFETLQWLTLSLFAQALIPLLARGYYAHRNTLTPFLVGIMADVVTVSLAIYLAPKYGVVALGMAFSAGAVVQVLGLWGGLRWRLGSLNENKIIQSLVRFTVAGLVMAFVTQGIKTGLGALLGTMTFIDVLVQGFSAGVAGMVTYFVVLWLLNAGELGGLISALRPGAVATGSLTESIEEGEGI